MGADAATGRGRMTWLTNPYRFGGGGGASLTARYWMFVPLAWPHTTGGLTVSEIGLAASSGGANLLSGGTATASHGTAGSAIDGNTTTDWGVIAINAQTAGALWLKVDCGSTVTATHFFVRSSGFSGQGNAAPPVWLVRNSADGVAYTDVMVVELGAVFGDGERRDVALVIGDFEDIEANARCWEFQFTAPASGDVWLRECQWRPTFGGADIGVQSNYAYNTNPYAGAGDYGLTKNLFDGSTSSLLVTTFTGPARIGVARTAPLGVMEEMRINPEGGGMPTAVKARWSVNGLNFHDKKAFTGISLSNGSWSSFDLR